MNLLFKLLYLNSKLELSLGYHNPALNNPALFIMPYQDGKFFIWWKFVSIAVQMKTAIK